MTTDRLTVLTLLVLLLQSLADIASAESAIQRPNVLLIVTDDQGYGDLACNGNPYLTTPNLDQLSATSVRLEDYHVDPFCTPTRAALLTGRHCSRVGAWAVINGRQLLHPREVTMANVFQNSGYQTAMFGKWHLGDPWPYGPTHRGFEEVVCHRAGGVDEIGNPVGNDFFDDVYYRNGSKEEFSGYCTDVFTQETIRYMKAATSNEEGKPFFIYLATNAMHSPFRVADRYADKFRAIGMPDKRARFYGMIENFDENLGRLLSALEELEIAENTIVIFMGDNGTAANSEAEGAFNAGMRGTKGSVYDGGHRVACYVRWPAGLQTTHAVDQLTIHRDWLPTLIDLCELQAPVGVQLDGRSMASLLQNEATEWPDRTLVMDRQGNFPVLATKPKPSATRSRYLVMTEKWRLVNGELYDIVADPSQTTDVSDQHPAVVESLRTEYEAYYADVYSLVDDEPCFIVGAKESPEMEFTARDWRPTQGGVIWETPQLSRDDLYIQGYWPIKVVSAGKYKITLSRYPMEHPQPIGADQARLEIDGRSMIKTVNPLEATVSFDMRLAVGITRLQAELRDATTKRGRGPYYVKIDRIQD